MSNAIIGGHIDVTIGTTKITLTSASLNDSPKTFSLPPGQSITISLADLNTYLSTNFGLPAINFSGITETSLVIQDFSISTAGFFKIAVNFNFGAGAGWEVFPGFTLNQVGFAVDYAKLPVITTMIPASAAANDPVVIQGNDLDNAEVKFGTTSATVTPGTNKATSLTVTVPATIAAGNSNVTVKNADGTSAEFVFTVK